MPQREPKPERHRTLKSSGNQYRVQVLDRAVRILECFGLDHRELSVSEIGTRTALHKSTTHRILMALEYNDLIKQNPATGKYHLGIKLFRLGNQAVRQFDFREICRPFLMRLKDKTQETVHLAIMDDGQVLYLEQVEGPHALRVPSRVGRQVNTHCTALGKAMLSCLEDHEVKQILGRRTFKIYTTQTTKNLELLLADLHAVRKRGYATDNEEVEPGLRCVGAPVRDHTGNMLAAISVAAPSARLTRRKLPVFGRIVRGVAADISRELGYEKPG